MNAFHDVNANSDTIENLTRAYRTDEIHRSWNFEVSEDCVELRLPRDKGMRGQDKFFMQDRLTVREWHAQTEIVFRCTPADFVLIMLEEVDLPFEVE